MVPAEQRQLNAVLAELARNLEGAAVILSISDISRPSADLRFTGPARLTERQPAANSPYLTRLHRLTTMLP